MRACRSAFKCRSLVFLPHPQHKSKHIPKSKPKIYCYPFLCLKVSSCRTPLLVHAYAHYSDAVQNGAYDRTVRVKLVLHRECQFGEEFLAVGEEDSLGSWDPQGAVPMKWNPGHMWITPPMDLPVGKEICFKFILRDKEGEIQWQPGPDRVFHSCETRGTLLVSLGWDDFDVQTITEEKEGEEYEEGIERSGVDRVQGGEIDGWVPVLVPGLKSEADSGGECDCSSIGNVPVLVPGLSTVMDDDRENGTEESENGLYEEKEEERVSVGGNSNGLYEEKEEERVSVGGNSNGLYEEKEEERVSVGGNSYAVSDNHASVSDVEEAPTISNEVQTTVVDGEEASTSTAMENDSLQPRKTCFLSMTAPGCKESKNHPFSLQHTLIIIISRMTWAICNLKLLFHKRMSKIKTLKFYLNQAVMRENNPIQKSIHLVLRFFKKTLIGVAVLYLNLSGAWDSRMSNLF